MATSASDILAAVDNPNVRKFRDMLAQAEGVKHGYNTGFGNTVLDSLEDHPRKLAKFTQTDSKGNVTSAAGRYQFLQKTWDGLKKQYPNQMPDFSAASQDFAATALLKNAGALKDVIKGNYQDAVQKSGAIWASLPSSPYPQKKRSWSEIGSYLGEEVSGGGGGAPVLNEVSTKDQNRLYLAYKSGAMNAQQAADYLKDVEAGYISMPKNAKPETAKAPKKLAPAILPDDLILAYNDGTLSGKPRADFEADFKAGKIVAPEGIDFELKTIKPETQPTTLLGDIGQGVKKLGQSIVGDAGAVDLITGIPKAVYGAGEALASGALGMGKTAAQGIYGTASGVANVLPQAIGGGGGSFGAGYEQGAQTIEHLIPNVPLATNAGQAIAQVMAAPSAEFARGGQAAGQAVERATGSQVLGGLTASGFETVGNALGIVAPLKARIAPEIAVAERTRQQITANPPEAIQPAARPSQEAPLTPSAEGLAAQAETTAKPVVEVGKPAIWRTADSDTPVVVKNIDQQAGSDGKIYARVERDGQDTLIPADELVATVEPKVSEPVTPKPETITPTATAVKPELLDITRSRPIEGGVTADIQQARHDVLRNIGLTDNEIRQGAVSGDTRVLGQENELAKADTEAGQAMQKQLDLEHQKLMDYGDNIVRDTGGTFGAEPLHRGASIVGALDSYAAHYKQGVSADYKSAGDRVGATGVPLTGFMDVLRDPANFKGGDGLSVRRDVLNVLRQRNLLNQDGTVKSVNAKVAEELRQSINESWDATKPKSQQAVGALVGALDESVFSKLGADEFATARSRYKQYKDIFENPKGIAQVLEASGPNGINRAVSLEKIGDKMRQFAETDSAQFEHIKQTLSNMPTKELQAAADKALGEIRAQIAEKITSAKTPAAIEKAYSPYRGAKLRQIFGDELASKIENYVAGVGVLRTVDKNVSGTASMARNLIDKAARGSSIGAGSAVGFGLGGGLGAAIGGMAGEALAGKIKGRMLEAIDAKTLDKAMSPKQFEVMKKVYESKLKALNDSPEMKQAQSLIDSGKATESQLLAASGRIEKAKQWLDFAKLLTPEQRSAAKQLGVIAWIATQGQPTSEEQQ